MTRQFPETHTAQKPAKSPLRVGKALFFAKDFGRNEPSGGFVDFIPQVVDLNVMTFDFFDESLPA
jgi:hypothetical protein